MKRALTQTALFGAMLWLAACGPMQADNRAVAAIKALAGQGGAGDSQASGAAPALTRAAVEAQEIDLLRVSIISREATALLGSAATNGTKVTWIAQEGVSLTFDAGLLVASRGFGEDLMGADVSGAKSSLINGGNHLRILDFLNGLDQIERRQFQCETRQNGSETIEILERTYATTIMEETCTSGSGGFKNTYWQDASGVIWQSRQWISDDVGYLGYQRL